MQCWRLFLPQPGRDVADDASAFSAPGKLPCRKSFQTPLQRAVKRSLPTAGAEQQTLCDSEVPSCNEAVRFLTTYLSV